MKLLNLGCGDRFHSAWTNVNFVSTGSGVIAYNLTHGIPFPDNSFDVVYHSHVLEHFSKTVAQSFLIECSRVLRPQGVLRVVIPDLEQIVWNYIKALELASSGSQEWAANYEWILLEMYDQTVRSHSGGEMAAYLSREHIFNEEFILNRCGIEGKKMIIDGKFYRQKVPSVSIPESKLIRFLKQIYRFFRYPTYRKELLLKSILGKEYTALEIGRFRQSGEIHQWMYDHYSLALLFKKCGFKNIIQRTATESYIPDWASWNLDTEPDGMIYKPDSLYMEAIKPAK